jgi:pimeloyl-ACP methyl ester carboxylesterase
MIRRFLTVAAVLCASLGTIAPAYAQTEIGELHGASFRIDVPEGWNGSLVLICHGYSPDRITFAAAPPSPATQMLLNRGFAVAESGFSAGGWAIKEALGDVETLRTHFIAKHGKVKETYLMGQSLGAFLTLALMERHPANYDAGLAMCGPLAPADWFMARRVFDVRVVLDYYYPGALPPLTQLPRDYEVTPARVQALMTLLQQNPQKLADVRRFAQLQSDQDVALLGVFFTDILEDLQRRSGGNGFDNRYIVYQGTSDDAALNDGVTRYAAEAKAANYLQQYYTPSGRLTKPMLAVTNTYDPLIPAWVSNLYLTLTGQAGSQKLFVQQYVPGSGHCTFTPGQIEAAFGELVSWKRSGIQPGAKPGTPAPSSAAAAKH